MCSKNKLTKMFMACAMAIVLMMLGVIILPVEVQAAGWPDYARELTLGNTITGSIKDGDYHGKDEEGKMTYWNVYKFSVPKDGLLNIYIESEEQEYFTYSTYGYNYNGFAIFDASEPDVLVWRSYYGGNKIKSDYSSARNMYYGSTEISLEQGEYYFAVRRNKTINTPYYLTLSYKEPVFHVSSISLDRESLKIAVGEQQTLQATILPNNATDKTVTWKSTNPSVATVDDGVVTAVSAGETSITVTSSDGEVSAICAVTVTPAIVKGDIDNVGGITLDDAWIALKAALKLDGITLDERQLAAADIDNNDTVDLTDVRLILKRALHIISDFETLS